MTTYTWPSQKSYAPMSGSFRLRPITAASISPYTGATKAANFGQIWMAKLTWNNVSIDIANELQSFLDQLQGAANTVLLFDWWRKTPLPLIGAGLTAPLVTTAASRGATSLTLNSLTASKEIFRKGDLFGVGGYLYEVTTGLTSNSSGNGTVTFQPGLRTGVASNDAITLYSPTVPMRLMNGEDAEIGRMVGNYGTGFSLTFAEDVP